MKHLSLRPIILLALVCAAAAPAFPQADVATATIKGTVTDENNAVLAGALVSVKSSERGIVRTAQTDGEGRYQISLLQPGRYELRVESAGFSSEVRDDLRLTIGQTAVYDVRLRVGGVATELVVDGGAPVIEVERTQQANTIQGIQIEGLPNVGRDLTAYVFTLPGVSNSESPRAQNPGFTFNSSGFSIGGSNGRNNLITIDGGENEAGSGQSRASISVEAVQEFQVNRNGFAAEFGFTAGTAVNVVTKSGTNRFDGSAYGFYRSQRTSATNVFNVGPDKAFERRVFAGATLGGPIVKNKFFFFTAFEQLRADTARFRQYTTNPAVRGPTAAQAAYLSQLSEQGDANMRRIADDLRRALTAVNSPSTLKLLRDNEGNFNAPDRLHNWTVRLDYQPGASDTLVGRFNLTHNDTDNLPGGSATTAPSVSANVAARDYTTLVSWSHILSPNAFNQFRAQASLNNSVRNTPRAPESTSLLIQGVGNFGRNFQLPFDTFQNRYQLEDTFSRSAGRHNFKLGASYRSVDYTVVGEFWFGGEWTFASGVFPVALALPASDREALLSFNRAHTDAAGAPIPDAGPAAANLSSIQALSHQLPSQFRQGFNNPKWQDWAHYLGVFAQDSWKAAGNLVIDYGLRFDYDAEPAPLQHRGYLSPRLGFAWSPGARQQTVIRGGAGLFYSPIYYQVPYSTNLLDDSGRYVNQVFKTTQDGAQSPAAIWAAGVARGTLPFLAVSEADLKALGVATGRGAAGRVIFDASPDYRNNYSIQANLGLSRRLPGDFALDAAYQMYKGVHLQVSHEVNYKETGVVSPQFGPQFTRIDPTVAQKNLYSSIGNSIYHGMTASLTKQDRRHYQLQVNYTFSKAIDDQTDFNSAFAAFIPTRLDLERAVSAFDIRHNFVASGVVRTPFTSGAARGLLARALSDVTVGSILYMRSGIPFTLRIGRDVNADTHGNYDRPYHAARNTGRGDNFYSLDMRVTKRLFLDRDRDLRVELIAEGTNLLNRSNFLSVNDVIGTDPKLWPAGFDLLNGPFNLRGSEHIPATLPLGFNGAYPKRQLQFGLKLAF
jgi:hypothetical protein